MRDRPLPINGYASQLQAEKLGAKPAGELAWFGCE
jgi:hypothetical protein